MTDDWNPNDPDATKVLYDLESWSFEQQAELAAELAEVAVPHAWEGSELVVPESHETMADSIVTEVEQRLGIRSGTDDADGLSRSSGFGEAPNATPIDIPAGSPATEYELEEWVEGDRQLLTAALTAQRIPYRWEDDLLLVATESEDLVEAMMDMIEVGEAASLEVALGDAGGTAGDDQLPFETLTTFFLAAERLQRNSLDADGLDQLLDALEVAEPERRPYGVDKSLWLRACALADELAGALVDSDEPDHETAMAVATDLHDLLRAYV